VSRVFDWKRWRIWRKDIIALTGDLFDAPVLDAVKRSGAERIVSDDSSLTAEGQSLFFLGFLGVLFNPAFTVHLSRGLWQIIDLVCGILFAGVGLLVRKCPPEQDQQ